MLPLTSEQLEFFRGTISGCGIPETRQDELIHIIDNIVISFVDQAFGLNSVQLSLSARANYAFKGAENRANLRLSGVPGPVDLDNEGAINDTGPERHFAP